MGSQHAMVVREDGRVDIKSFTQDELASWFASELGEPPHRALITYKWLWQRGATRFDQMDDLAKSTQRKLEKAAYISFLEPHLVLRSTDGTMKFLWRLEDGRTIESVLIPDGNRMTLCMSSQVGCAMACTFCLTGDLGLKRHLKPSEIANQPMQVGQQLPDGTRITNLVLMGMGEPLHNLGNLCDALEICLDDHALNFSHRKITVSTVGLVPKMAELAARLPVNLAVSLNASTEEQRRQIMPITRKWSVEELMQACRDFPLPSGKRITFEYVMFGGINDTLEDADRVLKMLEDVPAKLNLIPYNTNPDRDLMRPSDADVKAFQDHCVAQGMHTTVRTTRGQDISAACGQLGKAYEQAVDRGWLEQARLAAGYDGAAVR
ncbi:MAG: 23S rRNA (adenine(2503)-C(2))-methyltransferase RlmN [Myxococcota bacterium]